MLFFIKKIELKIRPDGVLYFEPKEFKYSYYIKCPNIEHSNSYDPQRDISEKFTLDIIPLDEEFENINPELTQQFNTLKESKEYIQTHFENILRTNLTTYNRKNM